MSRLSCRALVIKLKIATGSEDTQQIDHQLLHSMASSRTQTHNDNIVRRTKVTSMHVSKIITHLQLSKYALSHKGHMMKVMILVARPPALSKTQCHCIVPEHVN